IYASSQAEGDAGDLMGTTLVAAVLRGKYATIASVGDSRAYLVRANALTQITRDHSQVEAEVASGRLSAAEAKRDPRRNILTHALGQKPKLDTKLPEIFELTLLPQDRRSEEHTSELQSRENLVCRLLLEKKKQNH